MWEDNMAVQVGSLTWVARVPSNLDERYELHQVMANLLAGNARGEVRIEDDWYVETGEVINWRIELPTVEEAIWDDKGRMHTTIIVEGDAQNPLGLRAEYPFYLTVTDFFDSDRSPNLGHSPDKVRIEWEMPSNAYDPCGQTGFTLNPQQGYAPILPVRVAREEKYKY